MRFFLEKNADYYGNNLFIIDKIAIIFLDKYNRASFCDIVFAY